MHVPETQSLPPGSAEPRPAADTLAPGTLLAGRYQIDGFLGEGGMGTVYRATHLALNHPVAVKALRLSLARPPG